MNNVWSLAIKNSFPPPPIIITYVMHNMTCVCHDMHMSWLLAMVTWFLAIQCHLWANMVSLVVSHKHVVFGHGHVVFGHKLPRQPLDDISYQVNKEVTPRSQSCLPNVTHHISEQSRNSSCSQNLPWRCTWREYYVEYY
jgi:hypothetical protein